MFDNEKKERVAQEWRFFCETGTADPGVVRDFIMASWRRSRAHDVNPDLVEACKVDREILQGILQTREDLIRISLPVIENLYSFIKGSQSIIILTDENGIILSRTGDPEYLTNSESYEPGIEYSERTVGTNGIGTALYLNEPVQIWAEEHFARRNHALSCSATPIHDPEGEVIGCLNLSCLWDQVHTHTLGMVKAAANSIEQQLRIESVLENKVALLQEKQGIFELINDGLLTLDNNLIITEINKRAVKMLGIGSGRGRGRPVGAFVLSGFDFDGVMHSGNKVYDQDATLQLAGGGVVTCTISATPVPSSTGLVITLREARSVRRMVNRYAGTRAAFTFDDIIGKSPQVQESIRLGRIAGKSKTNVLILGESGTGKEMFAQAIHNSSDRRSGPFVAVNCGALPRDLIQSELFGYADGAFTGARRHGNPGKFELADGGTIFLDEIGEMPISAQVNLLRVVESKEVVRLGDSNARPVDVRIIAATNRQLLQEVAGKAFREDLYYRLNVLTVNLPPLRVRAGDVRVLVNHFLETMCPAVGRQQMCLGPDVYMALSTYQWPGNIRELQNVIERAVHVCQGNVISTADIHRILHMPETGAADAVVSEAISQQRTLYPGLEQGQTLKDAEFGSIMDVLRQNRGNVRRSAVVLGVARSTLYEKIRKLGIDVAELR